MRVALATMRELFDWEVDDRPLVAALQARGAEVVEPPWDSPDEDWGRFDAVLIRTTWDYMDRRDEFVRWAERVEAVTTLLNPARVVRWNTHKHYLRELEAGGARLAPTLWLERGSQVDMRDLLAGRGWGRAFIKPVVGASAIDTLRFRVDEAGLAEAQAHVDRLLPADGLMVQPYLARVETEGELSAVFIAGEITHVVRKVPVPGDYRVQDDYGASDGPAELEPEGLAAARAIVAQVDAELTYARVDFLRDDDGRLCLTELELVEPSLFFRHCPVAAEKLAEAVLARARSV